MTVSLIDILPAPAVELGPARDWSNVENNHALRRDYDEAWEAAGEELEALYPSFSLGEVRWAFDGGPVVYKVGCFCSQTTELAAFENPSTVDGLPVARCRMVHHANGAPILIMETVKPASFGDDVPAWASRVDSHQVGQNSAGEWVIFDAGNGVDEKAFIEASDPECWMEHDLPSTFQIA